MRLYICLYENLKNYNLNHKILVSSDEYNDLRFVVSDPVIETKESEYEGLFGYIREICDGNDKETDNDKPDIYCSFEPPILPSDIAELERELSELYGEPKILNDIALNEVIMAPEMIHPLNLSEQESEPVEIYVLVEDWTFR